MTEQQRNELLTHLQTAVEIELSTIPVYLYTYYSLNRMNGSWDNLKNGDQLATFANKAGGLIMSVAIEEMLHMSLACNILRALGGQPKLYLRSPASYPTNLPHHKKGFAVGLEALSEHQLKLFLGIEKPEKKSAPPEGKKWETIGQFYDYITKLIKTTTTDADYKHGESQLGPEKKYYSANNVDTVYPKDAYYLQKPEDPHNPVARGADQAQYPNNKDSGGLVTVTDKASALKAISIIKHQGEGYPNNPKHKDDDPEKDEDTHWYKYNELHKELKKFTPKELATFIYKFPKNPTLSGYASGFAPLVNLANAVYSYLFLMTETSYMLKGHAQSSMFYIGMHKGMIFILDKILAGMRYLSLNNAAGEVLAPTFENYAFSSLATAKQELVTLCEQAASNPSLGLDQNILQRIKDLPDVNVVNGVVSFA